MADLPPWPWLYAGALVRIGMLIAFLYGWLPRWVWPGLPAGLEGALARAALTFFALGLLVHALIALRIYEGLALVLLACLLPLARLRRRGLSPWRQWHWILARWADGLAAGALQQRLAGLARAALRWRPDVRHLAAALPWALPAGVAAWQRFAGAFQRISPALSDAPVTLAWLRMLEHAHSYMSLYADGVYPMGMYTFLTLVRKLSFLNPVVVLQATGPLVGWGLVLAGGAAVAAVGGGTVSAAAYMWLYGTMAGWLPVALDRHAAHNSQEFGLLFLLPAVALALRYLLQGERWRLWGAAAAAGMAVLTHPVPATYVALALAAAVGAATLLHPRLLGRALALAGATAAAAALAAVPVAAGLLAGRPWHASSAAYLAMAPPPTPPPPLWAWAVPAAAMALGAVACTLARGKPPARGGSPAVAGAGLAALGLGAAALAAALATHAPRFGVPVRFLFDRGQDPMAMLVAAAAAVGAGAATAALPARWRGAAGAALVVAMALSWWAYPPQVANPYRIYSDAMLYQYLRIDAGHNPGTWVLVAGPDGYALALGRAHHIYPHDLADPATGTGGRYAVTAEGIVDRATGQGPVRVDIYFIADFSVPEGGELVAPLARERERESRILSDWVQRARRAGLPIGTEYDDGTVAVYSLRLPRTGEDVRREILSHHPSPLAPLRPGR